MQQETLSASVRIGERIEIITRRQKKLYGVIERAGTIFPGQIKGRPTTLIDITGKKKDRQGNPARRGLALRFPHDLFQAILEDGTRVLLFAIEKLGDKNSVTYFKDEKHELLLSSVLMQGQIQVSRELRATASFTNSSACKVVKKTQELKNRVPGDSSRILWSEDTVNKLTKNITMSAKDSTPPSSPAPVSPKKQEPKPVKKRGRPRKNPEDKSKPKPRPTPRPEKSKPARAAPAPDMARLQELSTRAADAMGILQKVFTDFSKAIPAGESGKRRGRPRKNEEDSIPSAKRVKSSKKSDETVQSSSEEEELLDF